MIFNFSRSHRHHRRHGIWTFEQRPYEAASSDSSESSASYQTADRVASWLLSLSEVVCGLSRSLSQIDLVQAQSLPYSREIVRRHSKVP